jgi:hypothetical protein
METYSRIGLVRSHGKLTVLLDHYEAMGNLQSYCTDKIYRKIWIELTLRAVSCGDMWFKASESSLSWLSTFNIQDPLSFSLVRSLVLNLPNSFRVYFYHLNSFGLRKCSNCSMDDIWISSIIRLKVSRYFKKSSPPRGSRSTWKHTRNEWRSHVKYLQTSGRSYSPFDFWSAKLHSFRSEKMWMRV